MFNDGMFSNLRKYSIYDKLVYVVDKHHYTLPIWANYSMSNKSSYSLVTLDYHPDTIRGFNDYAFDIVQKLNPYTCDFDEVDKICVNEIEKLKNSSIKTLIKSLKHLSNDEHIRTAYDLGYLNEYHVINCLDTDSEPGSYYYLNEKCSDICIPTIKTGVCNGNCPDSLSKYKMNRLEDHYFNDMEFSIPDKPFILDFDLDYFPTRESVNPLNKKVIMKLIRNAELITVAREKHYFNECKKQKNFTVQEAEVLLIELIKSTLEQNILP